MLIFRGLSILYLLFLVYLTYLSLDKYQTTKRFVVKMITSTLFVALFVNAVLFKHLTDTRTVLCYIGAISMSFLGDLLLGLYNHDKTKKLSFFFAGTILFFAAQIFYILCYIRFDNFKLNTLYFVIPTLALIFACLLLEKLKVKKSVLIVGCIYALALSSMFSTTLIYSIAHNTPLILIAGFTFFVSDFTISIKYFSKERNKAIVLINTITYYLAQLMFIITLIIY